MRRHHFYLRIISVAATLSFCFLTAGKADFTITGYQQNPSGTDLYDIFGTGLTSVTSLTDATFSVRGDSNSAVAFTTVSDQELQFQVGQNLSNYVDLQFSSVSFTDIEVTYSTTAFPVGLTIVQSGQYINGAGGSAQVLVETGGFFGSGGGGSNTVFVEAGAEYTGSGGGGSETIFYAPGSTVLQSGGGGGETYDQVNAIHLLQAVPEPSSWLLVAGGLSAVLLLRRLQTKPESNR